MGLPIYDRNFTQEEIDFGFEKYVEGVTKLIAGHYTKLNMDIKYVQQIRVDEGRVYWKLVKHIPGNSHNTSVYGFVRKADGAILKAATWKAPALNHARGFVTDSDYGLHNSGEYGVVNLNSTVQFRSVRYR